MYDAWEAGTARERVRLARQALALSELCVDAHVLLAENSARTTVEARDHYRRGVAAGEKALGPEAFERDAGHFWGLLETRPYMRARSGLADCLWALDERSAAIGHYREMLRLNPNDNQGLRHVLTSWLFTTGDLDALEELLDAYDNDAFVEWAYAKVLLAFRKGDRADADASLAAAWKRNPHVPGPDERRQAAPPPSARSLRHGISGRSRRLRSAERRKLVGDPGRPRMAFGGRIRSPATGEETALNDLRFDPIPLATASARLGKEAWLTAGVCGNTDLQLKFRDSRYLGSGDGFPLSRE